MANSLEGLVGAFLSESHVTKKVLAEGLGCTPETLNKKLRGKSPITVIEARKLASLMGSNVESTFNEICRLATR